MINSLPNREFFLVKALPRYTNYVVAEYVDSGANGHVFRAYSTEFQRDLAVKVIPKSKIENRIANHIDWKLEFQKPNRLETDIAVKFVDYVDWVDQENAINCIAVLSDFVYGISLKKFIRKNRKHVTIKFIEDFLKAMMELLFNMENNSISHGDLHAGNILIAKKTEKELLSQEKFKVTDFGIATAYAANIRKMITKISPIFFWNW